MNHRLTPEFSRRALLQGVAAAAVTVTSGCTDPGRERRSGSGRDAEKDISADPSYMSADQAERLAASVGVVTHLDYATSVYGQTDRVVRAVADLGVRHVRNRITLTPSGRRGFTLLAQEGVKVHGVCGAFGDPQTMFTVMNEVVRTYPDPETVFSAFEGINEPNNNGVPWIAETRSKTRTLFLQRNGHGLRSVPIVAPALAAVNSGGVQGRDTRAQSANLGDLTDYIDFGNVHVYPRARTPSSEIDAFMSYQRMVCGDLPIVCTEGGYFTAANYRGGAFPTLPEAAANYIPRQIMEHWIRSNKRFFVYELLDDYDPTSADRESNFGLMTVSGLDASANWTPKPHYQAIKNFVSILGDKGEPHDVGGMNLSIWGVLDLKTSLVAKRNGVRYLLMWRDISSYDARTRSLIPIESQTARVTLPDVVGTVAVYNPTESASAVQTFENVDTFDVQLADQLLICSIG